MKEEERKRDLSLEILNVYAIAAVSLSFLVGF